MKTLMSGAVLALALTTAAATPLQAQTLTQPPIIAHGPKAAVDAVVKAEHYYSDRVGAVGVAKGMSEFIDPADGLAFTGAGDPARGSKAVFAAYGGDAPSPLKLSWVPAEVFAADGGDMAASWGRFTLVSTDPKVKTLTGRYVTVWRKGADGQWKAVMDIGNPDG
jgi:ketosteroid isomerase-like protein